MFTIQSKKCFLIKDLDSDSDIPDKGVNSRSEWLYDEDLEEPDLNLPADSAVLLDVEDEEINLQTVQI